MNTQLKANKISDIEIVIYDVGFNVCIRKSSIEQNWKDGKKHNVILARVEYFLS